MCGITGYFDYRSFQFELDSDRFNKIIDSMRHRGPDGRGCFQKPGLGLGHRRLAIIDVQSERSNQPMQVLDGKVWISYNGEIYNYLELRKELIERGHKFRTKSDTEVILNAYLEWGIDCVQHFSGIFAFCIWDKRISCLWLVRDQLGVKPLFYSDTSGLIHFASEISTILEYPGIQHDYDPQGIDSLCTFGYVPAPLTGFKHIKQLLPGQYLKVTTSGIQSHKYWDLKLDSNKLVGSENELLEEYQRLFHQSVKRQMVSDVDIGAFLSSGTDSFAVVDAMRKENNENINLYSIGFNNQQFNELENTKLAADALNIKLNSKIVDVDFDAIFNKVRPHTLEPFADSSCVPTYQLCKLASQDVKVALSGDGADELLGGYDTYKANKYAEIYRSIPNNIRQLLIKPLTRFCPDIGGKYTYKEKLRRFIYGAEKGQWRDHCSWRTLLSDELKDFLYTSEFRKETADFDAIGLYADPMLKARENGCEKLDCYLYADLTFYLPNDMLVKMDRMGMAHGLEVRVPFLDLEFVEFCWRLPTFFKIKNGKTKYILKESIRDNYPKKLQNLPKSGFNLDYDYLTKDYLAINNRFMNKKNLNYQQVFSRYHFMMIDYLLKYL